VISAGADVTHKHSWLWGVFMTWQKGAVMFSAPFCFVQNIKPKVEKYWAEVDFLQDIVNLQCKHVLLQYLIVLMRTLTQMMGKVFRKSYD